jgi:hypothetical protein
MATTESEHAASTFAGSRPGYVLEAFSDIVVPVHRLSFAGIFREERELPFIERSVLGAIASGLTDVASVSGLLGMTEEFFTRGPLTNLLRSEDVDHVGSIQLTAKGVKTLETARTAKDVEISLNVFYDGLLRRLIPLGRRPLLLKSSEARKEGFLVVETGNSTAPKSGEVGREDVRRVLAEDERRSGRRGRFASHALLAVVGLDSRRQLLYRPGTLLVFRRGDDRQLGVVFEGEASPDHEPPIARAGLLDRFREEAPKGMSAEELCRAQGLDEQPVDMEPIVARIAELSRAVENVTQERNRQEDVNQAQVFSAQIAEKDAEIALLKDQLAAVRYRLVAVAEHRGLLEKALAEAKERVVIACPFISAAAVNAELVEWLRRALARGVSVLIGYGMGDENRESQGGFAAGVQRLEGLRARFKDRFTLRYLPSKGRPSHAKVLICDAEYFILTSFNWLSFKGDEGRAFRNEQGVLIKEATAVQEALEFWLKEIQTTGLPGPTAA